MTFWATLKESLLEMLIGRNQLQAWRAEAAARKECERVQRRLLKESQKAVSVG